MDSGETWVLRFLDSSWHGCLHSLPPGLGDSVSAIENFLALVRKSPEVDKTLQWLSEGIILRPDHLLVLSLQEPLTLLYDIQDIVFQEVLVEWCRVCSQPCVHQHLPSDRSKESLKGRDGKRFLSSIRREEWWDLIGNLGPASLECRRELRDGSGEEAGAWLCL